MVRFLLIALPVVCFGCGSDEGTSAGTAEPREPAATASSPAAKPARKGTKVVLRESQFGKILFNADRQAIYLFDREGSSKPRCYGACAEAWPPVYANGKPRLGKGLDGDLLGTAKRRGGRRQVTYGGHPLYYYAHEGPGQVLCHDIVEFGGTWLVVKRSGKPVPSSS
jgi:predicted lipoprotein with Yx(FWY)xxD motif